jgi:catechol 2,3-dioxygenase-like lactoylglutathione lyase family enzyme
MSVRRIVPNVRSRRAEASRAFYVDVLGLRVAMDMGFIMTFASPSNPTAQLSVLLGDDGGGRVQPDVTVEVADVDAVHARAVEGGVEVVYPLTDEPWGVRRFFARDPNGVVVNVMTHRPVEPASARAS